MPRPSHYYTYDDNFSLLERRSSARFELFQRTEIGREKIGADEADYEV